MSDQICVICWSDKNIEEHHIAGRANHPRTVPLCHSCHARITTKQHRQGIDLTVDWRPYQAKARAIILGHLEIWQLAIAAWGANFTADLADIDDTISPPKPLYGN